MRTILFALAALTIGQGVAVLASAQQVATQVQQVQCTKAYQVQQLLGHGEDTIPTVCKK